MLKVINNLNGYTCANVKEREEKKVKNTERTHVENIVCVH